MTNTEAITIINYYYRLTVAPARSVTIMNSLYPVRFTLQLKTMAMITLAPLTTTISVTINDITIVMSITIAIIIHLDTITIPLKIAADLELSP